MVEDRLTKKCKCGYFIPDEYELCNYCLLKKYKLSEIGFSVGYDGGLYRREDVLRALREAERGNKNG